MVGAGETLAEARALVPERLETMPALASPDHHAPAASSFPGTCPAPADPLDSLAALSDVEVLGRLLGPRGGELASRALEHAGNLPRLSILSPSHLRSLRLGARATGPFFSRASSP